MYSKKKEKKKCNTAQFEDRLQASVEQNLGGQNVDWFWISLAVYLNYTASNQSSQRY